MTIIFITGISFILLAKLQDQIWHIKLISSFFICCLQIFIFVFFLKKLLFIYQNKIPKNILLNYENNKINNEKEDFVKIYSKRSKTLKYIDANINLNINKVHLNNFKKLLNPSTLNKKNITLLKQNEDIFSKANSNIHFKQNNYLDPCSTKKSENTVLTANKPLFSITNIKKDSANNYILKSSFLNVLNKYQPNQKESSNEIYMIKKGVMNSFDLFVNFSNFFMQRNIFDLFELKNNYIHKKRLISEKFSLIKNSYEDLKLSEKEILKDNENKFAIDILNKKFFKK